MRSSRRDLLLALCALVSASCLQELDPHAAQGTGTGNAVAANDPVTESATTCSPVCPTGQFCLGGTCMPDDTNTPAIELADGTTTSDACVATAASALAIRKQFCSGCHAPPAKMGGFDSILDDTALLRSVSSVTMDAEGKPAKLVVPGDPEGSRLYQRMRRREMPPTQAPPLPAIPMPSVSDISVMYTWISDCLGAKPAKPVSDAGVPADGGDGGGV